MRGKNILVTSLINNNKLNKKSNKIYLVDDFSDLESNKNREENQIIETNWSDNKFTGNQNILIKYKLLLKQLTKDLNNFHNTRYSEKFWELILGPWCITFINKYLENYYGIKEFFNKKKFSFHFIKTKKNTFIPFDNKEFIIFTSNHFWQNNMTKMVIDDNFLNQVSQKKINRKIILDYFSMDSLYNFNFFISEISLFLLRFSKILVLNIPMSIFPKIKLFFKLKQFGKIFFENHYKIKKINRDTFLSKYKKLDNNLNNIIYNRLIENIPTMALENFKDLTSIINKKYKKINPSKIFLTTGLVGITEQLFFCALKKEKGSYLIINQHGGRYNMLKDFWFENHEKKISDKFISWGIKGKKNNKTKYIGYPNKKFVRKKNPDKLLVALSPNKDFIMYSENRKSRADKNFFCLFNKKFLDKLNNEIKENNLFFKFKNNFQNLNLNYFTKKNISLIKLDSSKSLSKSVLKSKLVITNTASTVGLETFGSNIPTILINDIDIRHYNTRTKILLRLLNKNNLYFENLEHAANFINKNWKNIDKWWFSKVTQAAVSEFTKNYCYYDENYSTKLLKLLKT